MQVTEIIAIIIQAIWLIFPAYVANASAVIVGGGKPIDSGRMYKDGKRLLGDGKTWRGLLGGTLFGITVGLGMMVLLKYGQNLLSFPLTNFGGYPFMLLFFFTLCFGALMGDIIESFFKRRIGKERGEDWFVLDQLDFIVGALVLTISVSFLVAHFYPQEGNWFMSTVTLQHILIIVIVTPFVHIATNYVYRKQKGAKHGK